jgi:hypothetical protein
MALDGARNRAYLAVIDFNGTSHLYAFDTVAVALLASATVPAVGMTGPTSIAVDGAGSIYVAGFISGSSVQGLISKFTPNFQLLWQTTQAGLGPSAGQTTIQDIAFAADGNLRVVATDVSTPTGSGPVAAYGASTGALVWRTEFLGNSTGWPQTTGLAVDGLANTYSVGLTYGSLDGGPPLTSGYSAWIAKYSPSGAFVAVDQVRSANSWATRAAADASGNIWVVGICRMGRVDNAACQANDYDAFIVKYGANLVRQ